MAIVEIKVPTVGESINEGILARWLKKPGEFVRIEEPLVEMETDKATQEITSPATGILRIDVAEGTTVLVGKTIGRIEEGVPAPVTAKAPAAAPEAAPAVAPAPPPAPVPASAPSRAPALSPSARVLVEASGIDPRQLTGSGRGGRIIKQDVLSAGPRIENGSPALARPRETRQKMTTIRQRIASRLVEAQHTTASLTTFNEADLSAIIDLRNRYKDKYKEKHGVNLGFMSFFVKACVEALKSYPTVNARIDGAEIVYQNFYDIGVAVSTDKGLMVPVLRDADAMSFAAIEKAIGDLAVKARDGKISVSDLQGGTFTITNGGIFGSMLSTPILNPPQTAILGMHAIQKRAVVVNDQIVVRPMMYLALTYDHRLIDGREAVLFLVRVKECLENPERVLLEI